MESNEEPNSTQEMTKERGVDRYSDLQESGSSNEDGEMKTSNDNATGAESDSTAEAGVAPKPKKGARSKKVRRDRITIVQNPSPGGPLPKSPDQVKSVNSASPAFSFSQVSENHSGSTAVAGTRQRVAGGAAAKIMLQGPKASPTPDESDEEEYTDNEDDEDYSYKAEELDHARRQARVEYDIGTDKNRRYKSVIDSVDESEYDMASEATLPSILDRSEVFHENASAAILALLNPRGKRNDPEESAESELYGAGGSTAGGGAMSPRSGTTSVASPTRSVGTGAFSPERTITGSVSPRRSIPNPVTTMSPERSPAASAEINSVSALDAPSEAIKKIPHQPLLNEKAERKLELMKKSMIDPSKTLADLLTAIASPAEGGEMDKAYMVRRKNACGALKVLTANTANRRTICWTVGVLPALASVLVDGSEGDVNDVFLDDRVRNEYIEARKRAVAALLNLSTLKENRVPIFHCPGLMYALGQTIQHDKEESRQGCCAIAGYLAKASENRLLLIKIPGMLDAMTTAIKPREITVTEKVRKKKYIWDTSDDSFSASTANRINSETTDLTHDESFRSGEDYHYFSPTNEDDSVLTNQMTNSPMSEASRRSFMYDNDPNDFVHATRQNVFATLLHVVKEKDNAYHLARNPGLLFALVEISYLQDSPSHTYALKILANLTRHRGNTKLLVFNSRLVVPALVHAMSSTSLESRTHAIFALQNLAQEKSCRQDIAITKHLVEALVLRVRLSSDMVEKLAAVATLKNLSDEPANLIPMSNTPDCFPTLMQVANGGEGITEMMQFQACDALATLSHTLRKIASTGGLDQSPKADVPKTTEFMNPSMRVVNWSQWT